MPCPPYKHMECHKVEVRRRISAPSIPGGEVDRDFDLRPLVRTAENFQAAAEAFHTLVHIAEAVAFPPSGDAVEIEAPSIISDQQLQGGIRG